MASCDGARRAGASSAAISTSRPTGMNHSAFSWSTIDGPAGSGAGAAATGAGSGAGASAWTSGAGRLDFCDGLRWIQVGCTDAAGGGAGGRRGAVAGAAPCRRASSALRSSSRRRDSASSVSRRVTRSRSAWFSALEAAPALPPGAVGGTSRRRGSASRCCPQARPELQAAVWRRTSARASPGSTAAIAPPSGRRSTAPARSSLMLSPNASGLAR